MNRLFQLYTKYSARNAMAEKLCPSMLKSVSSNGPLDEIKHRIGKSSQLFPLENWVHNDQMCVGRWVGQSSGIGSKTPAGAYSWGIWWKSCNLGAYRIHDPYGNLLAYRLDVLKDVRIRKNVSPAATPAAATAGLPGGTILHRGGKVDLVEFCDLVVDIWIWPDEAGMIGDGDITVEDLDEFDEMQRKGVLSTADSLLINTAIHGVLEDPSIIVQDINATVDLAITHNAKSPL